MLLTEDNNSAMDKKIYKILVCGGRNFGDLYRYNKTGDALKEARNQYNFIQRTLDNIAVQYSDEDDYDEHDNWLPSNITIINGGATGADSASSSWAIVNWVPFVEYLAKWELHGNAAGPIRNQYMLDTESPIDLCVAFPGGKGTQDMENRCIKAGISVIKPKYNKDYIYAGK